MIRQKNQIKTSVRRTTFKPPRAFGFLIVHVVRGVACVPAPSSWVPWSSLVTRVAPARQVLRALPGRPESSQKLVVVPRVQ